MASLVKIGDKFSVRYKGSDGKLKKLALGIGNDKRANEALLHVEELVEADRTGSRVQRHTVAWVEKQDLTLQVRLAKAVLIELRRDGSKGENTLGPFLKHYVKTRSDVKGSTATVYGHTVRNLLAYFGADKPLGKITPGDADEFRLHLLDAKGEALAEATARRRCTLAGQFFRSATRKGLLKTNPFAGVGGMVKSNKARVRFISREDSAKVLDACPDAEWRLIFALSRFGGLRTPSEHDRLRWVDVNWEANKFLVHSPKTEHHEGGESRWVPIFPELRPHLDQARHAAEPGAEFVLAKYRNQVNLRTRFTKVIERAGLTPWPKLFQNLRSTRQSELEAEYGMFRACKWIGNKAAVAAEHYLQMTDADFDRAAASGTSELVQKSVHNSAVTGTNRQQTALSGVPHLSGAADFAVNQWAIQDSNL